MKDATFRWGLGDHSSRFLSSLPLLGVKSGLRNLSRLFLRSLPGLDNNGVPSESCSLSTLSRNSWALELSGDRGMLSVDAILRKGVEELFRLSNKNGLAGLDKGPI